MPDFDVTIVYEGNIETGYSRSDASVAVSYTHLDVYKRQAIYDSEIGNITRSEKNWKDVLKVAGQLYRYEFDNIVMITAQSCLLYTSRCV